MKFDYASINQNDLARLSRFAEGAFSSKQGVSHTFLVAEQAIQAELQGAFVECGVAAGALACTLAYAIQKHRQTHLRKVHLFDSFDGIPYAGPKDVDQPGFGHIIMDQHLPIAERLKSSGISIGTQEQVKHNIQKWGVGDVDFVFHPGWFQHTLPNLDIPNAIGQIAVLRLDGDLYESTECCMKYLYPHVVPGGYVIHDDYPMEGSYLAFHEYFKDSKLPELSLGVDTGAAVWRKPGA